MMYMRRVFVRDNYKIKPASGFFAVMSGAKGAPFSGFPSTFQGSFPPPLGNKKPRPQAGFYLY